MNKLIVCPRCFSQEVKLINKKKEVYRCVRDIPDSPIQEKCDWTFSKKDVNKNYVDLLQKSLDRNIIAKEIKKQTKEEKHKRYLKTVEEGNKVIKVCDCKSEYQDKKYGKNKRVFNKMNSTSTTVKYRCTVCGKEK